MNETYLHMRIFILLFITVFVISCKKEKKINLTENELQTSRPFFNTEAYANSQIAEYIREVIQDKNGHLWFGTNSYGVAHFDGVNLSYFSNKEGFNGRQVTGITEDLDNNIWFSTDQGIVKYSLSVINKDEKIFTNFTDSKIFKDNYLRSIFSDSKGTLWVGTREGVSKFDGINLEPFALPYSKKTEKDNFFSYKTIWSITEDSKGNIWFGTNGNGAFKYNGKTFEQYTKEDGLTDNSVDNILEDRNGHIWFGTRHGGVSHYNHKIFTYYTQNDSIGNNEVCVIYEDMAGNIWLSSEGFGVYRFDRNTFTNYSEKQGLGVQAVQTIFEDKEGRFWVGGGGGLFRYDGHSFFNVTKDGPWK